ncbi:hypothetical protein FA13DRAFT_1304269 [Coprinellus micaceus]|uniref:Uncharacterized protein n=1 Tax=Coprinellus micaceus TaxID=71717 RepID=A0A4Y7STF3_COPMI|nr:hypothetical protein FA13DRAFT_1304269 [Coprinellus micaceus]
MSIHAAFPDATMNTYDFDLNPPLPPIPSSSTLVVEGGSREQWATFFEGVDVTSGLLDIGGGQSSQAACQTISGTAFTNFGFVQQGAPVLDIEQFLDDDALPPNLFEGLSGDAVRPARDDDRATFDFGEFISSTASQDPIAKFSPEDKALFGLPPSPSPQRPQLNLRWFDESPQEYALDDFINAPTQCLNDSPGAFDGRWEIDTPSKDFASEPLPRSGLDDYPGPSTLARDAPRGTLQPYVADDLGDGPYAPAPFLDALDALPGPDFTFDDDPFQPGPSNWAEHAPMDWPSLPTTSSYGDFLEPVVPEALPSLPTGTQALYLTASSNPALGPLEESGSFAWGDYNKHQQYHQQQVAAAHLPVPMLPACPPVPSLASASPLRSAGSKRRNEDTADAGAVGICIPRKKQAKTNKENSKKSKITLANTVDPGSSAGHRQPLVNLGRAADPGATKCPVHRQPTSSWGNYFSLWNSLPASQLGWGALQSDAPGRIEVPRGAH